MTHYRENLTIFALTVGILTLEVALPYSGKLLRHGLFVLAFAFLWKAISHLRCTVSDMVLTAVILVLIALSRFVSPAYVSPLIFEIAALVLTLVFLSTGLSLKAIAEDRKNRIKVP